MRVFVRVAMALAVVSMAFAGGQKPQARADWGSDLRAQIAALKQQEPRPKASWRATRPS